MFISQLKKKRIRLKNWESHHLQATGCPCTPHKLVSHLSQCSLSPVKLHLSPNDISVVHNIVCTKMLYVTVCYVCCLCYMIPMRCHWCCCFRYIRNSLVFLVYVRGFQGHLRFWFVLKPDFSHHLFASGLLYLAFGSSFIHSPPTT